MTLVTAWNVPAVGVQSTHGFVLHLHTVIEISAGLVNWVTDKSWTADADVNAVSLDAQLGIAARSHSAVEFIVSWSTIDSRITLESLGTLAPVRTERVLTDSSLTTLSSRSLTLVNVLTTGYFIRLSSEASFTETLRHAIDEAALSIEPAKHRVARVSAFLADVRLGTDASLSAITVGVTRTRVVVGNATLDVRHASNVRIAFGDRRTFTRISAPSVRAQRANSTADFLALVNVRTAALGMSTETGRTRTRETAEHVGAISVFSTHTKRPKHCLVTFINVFTHSRNIVRNKRKPLVADAQSTLTVRFALRMRSTVDIITYMMACRFWITDQVSRTRAFVAAIQVHALGIVSARERRQHALVYISTWNIRWRSLISSDALTHETARSILTFGLGATWIGSHAFVPIDTNWSLSFETSPATAGRLDTSRAVRAFRVHRTRHAHRDSFTGDVRRSVVAFQTLALITSEQVDAGGTDTTPILLGTLVYV